MIIVVFVFLVFLVLLFQERQIPFKLQVQIPGRGLHRRGACDGSLVSACSLDEEGLWVKEIDKDEVMAQL